MKKKLFYLILILLSALCMMLITGCKTKPQLPFDRGDKAEEFLPFEINEKNIKLQKDKQYDVKKNMTLYAQNVNYLSFKSEDIYIATIDNDGILTAVNEGESEIIVTYKDDEFISSDKLQIKVVDLDIYIESAAMPLVKIGDNVLPSIVFNYNDIGLSVDDVDFDVKEGWEYLEYKNGSFCAVGVGIGKIKISLKKDFSIIYEMDFETDFADRLVGWEIRTALNMPTGYITKEDLTFVTSLNLESFKITSTNDLFMLTGMTKINLSNTKLANYSFILNYELLTELDISDNGITEISFLNNCNSLEYADLSKNAIKDISIFENHYNIINLNLFQNLVNTATLNCYNLYYLDLSENALSGAALNCVNLTYLNLTKNSISNITLNCPSLVYADLSQNVISSIVAGSMERLQVFNACLNRIPDFGFLANSAGMQDLNISNNVVSNANFLERMTDLTKLDVSSNQITSLSYLNGKSKLVSLKARDCAITAIGNLSETLTYIDIRYNRMTSTEFLSGCTQLSYVDLRNNSLSAIDGLSNSKKIQYIDIGNNAISTLTPLLGSTEILRLIAPDNRITSLIPIQACAKLQVLDMANNSLTNANAVATLKLFTSLEELYIGGNISISDMSFLNTDAARANLKRLNIGGINANSSAVTAITSYVPLLYKLEWLELYQLNLTTATFITQAKLPNLKYLKISHNRITNSANFSTLSYITTVDKSYQN